MNTLLVNATVRTLIEAQASQRPQAVYACTPQEKVQGQGQEQGPEQEQHQAAFTFAELARSCRQTTALLCALGSQPGETVSLAGAPLVATADYTLRATRVAGAAKDFVDEGVGPEQRLLVGVDAKQDGLAGGLHVGTPIT